MERTDFSYTYNARGYMLQYRGQNIGGAGILPTAKGPRGRGVSKQMQDYKRLAEIDIQSLLRGAGSAHMKNRIAEINA